MKKNLLLPACLVCLTMATQAQNTELPPPPPPPAPPKVEVVKLAPPVINDEEIQEFYKRNPSVAMIAWKEDQKIVLTLKDNTKEKYNLSDEKENKAFTDKYGEAPQIVPPPPPPPPAKPKTKIQKLPPIKIQKDSHQ